MKRLLEFFGPQPPDTIQRLRPGGTCPNCQHASKFELATDFDLGLATARPNKRIAIGYACTLCHESVAIEYTIVVRNNYPILDSPRLLNRSEPAFDFEHVPTAVESEVREALRCFSVAAFNGFAAVSRRAVQEICTNLGAKSSTRVQAQLREMAEQVGLDQEGLELAEQVMLAGHDGAHPHLPTVDRARAELLLSLLQDLTYQLYTRPGKVRASAQLRKDAQRTK